METLASCDGGGGGGDEPLNQRRPPSHPEGRIKLSRELMQRLASALSRGTTTRESRIEPDAAKESAGSRETAGGQRFRHSPPAQSLPAPQMAERARIRVGDANEGEEHGHEGANVPSDSELNQCNRPDGAQKPPPPAPIIDGPLMMALCPAASRSISERIGSQRTKPARRQASGQQVAATSAKTATTPTSDQSAAACNWNNNHSNNGALKYLIVHRKKTAPSNWPPRRRTSPAASSNNGAADELANGLSASSASRRWRPRRSAASGVARETRGPRRRLRRRLFGRARFGPDVCGRCRGRARWRPTERLHGIKLAHKLRLVMLALVVARRGGGSSGRPTFGQQRTLATRPNELGHYDHCYYHANEPASSIVVVVVVAVRRRGAQSAEFGDNFSGRLESVGELCYLLAPPGAAEDDKRDNERGQQAKLIGRELTRRRGLRPTCSVPRCWLAGLVGRVLFIADASESKPADEKNTTTTTRTTLRCTSAVTLGAGDGGGGGSPSRDAPARRRYHPRDRCRLSGSTLGRSLSRAFIGSTSPKTTRRQCLDMFTVGDKSTRASASPRATTSTKPMATIRDRAARRRLSCSNLASLGAQLQSSSADSASRRPETSERNANERPGKRTHQHQTDLPLSEATERVLVRRDHFYDRQPNCSNSDYLLLQLGSDSHLLDIVANDGGDGNKRQQQQQQGDESENKNENERKRGGRKERQKEGEEAQKQRVGATRSQEADPSCCFGQRSRRRRQIKVARPKTVIGSSLPCERAAHFGGQVVGRLAADPLSTRPSARNQQMNSRPSCDRTPRSITSRTSSKLVEATSKQHERSQKLPLVSNNKRHHQRSRPDEIGAGTAKLSSSSIWLLWTFAALVLASLVWAPNRTSLIMQSSATPLSESAPLAASADRTDNRSTTKLDDELSRAVLATMGTQSSLSGARERSSQGTRPLAMAQGGLKEEELDEGGETTRVTGDERELDQPAPLSPPAVPDASNGLEQLQQLDDRQSRQPSPNAGQLDALLGNVSEFARIFAMVAIMIGDICGNSLVILSVVRHSKLRVTTNWFVVSLACADILVALFAMTFNASVQITGRWIFPRWMCDFWNSCDVLASTASILHLCCISIDRYYAIMRPLDYPMKITTRRVCYALAVVWISSALLSYIPIFTGIYTTNEHDRWQLENPDQCEFVVNRVYAIVSSSISFWIPCCIMVFTYWRIYREATRQEKFIYRAQNMLPAPQLNHSSNHRTRQQRSKSMAITSFNSGPDSNKGNKQKGAASDDKREQPKQTSCGSDLLAVANSSQPTGAAKSAEKQPLTGSAIDLNNNSGSSQTAQQQEHKRPTALTGGGGKLSRQQQQEEQDERDSNSGQSTPTKRSISKMKREHKAAKTLGIIMGVFIICWLPFFCWYTPVHICGPLCDQMVPKSVVTLLFWIGYFNSTLNPIIYAYFNHEFRDAFKKTLQWIFCCCRDLKCLRVNRPNDNQHYNCTYRSTQEIGLVTNG